MKRLPISPSDLMSAFQSGDRAGIERMAQEMMAAFQSRAAEDGFGAMDKAFAAQWRFERLLDALGAPAYAMHFGYGAEDDSYDLPEGSIVHVGETDAA